MSFSHLLWINSYLNVVIVQLEIKQKLNSIKYKQEKKSWLTEKWLKLIKNQLKRSIEINSKTLEILLQKSAARDQPTAKKKTNQLKVSQLQSEKEQPTKKKVQNDPTN